MKDSFFFSLGYVKINNQFFFILFHFLFNDYMKKKYICMLLTAILILFSSPIIMDKNENERYNIKNHTQILELLSVLPFVFVVGM
jgi:hypothetical protein